MIDLANSPILVAAIKVRRIGLSSAVIAPPIFISDIVLNGVRSRVIRLKYSCKTGEYNRGHLSGGVCSPGVVLVLTKLVEPSHTLVHISPLPEQYSR